MSDRREQGVALVHAFLASMDGRQRAVLERLLLKGESERQVALALRIPLVAVRRHHARGKTEILKSETIAKALPFLRMQDDPRQTLEDRLIERIDQRRSA